MMPSIERCAAASRAASSPSRWRGFGPDSSGDARRGQRILHLAASADAFHGASGHRRRREAARRRPAATTLVFFGQGGAGTTTMAVNCASRSPG